MSTNYLHIFNDFCDTHYIKASRKINWMEQTDSQTDSHEMFDRWAECQEMIAFTKVELANQAQKIADNVKSHKRFKQLNAHWSDIRNPVEKMTHLYGELDYWLNERDFVKDQIIKWMRSVEGKTNSLYVI